MKEFKIQNIQTWRHSNIYAQKCVSEKPGQWKSNQFNSVIFCIWYARLGWMQLIDLREHVKNQRNYVFSKVPFFGFGQATDGSNATN